MEESTIAKQNKNVLVLPWMRSPVDVSKFEECLLDILPCLDPRLKMALQNMGFKTLFPVQLAVWQETIGPGAFERDLCINSPTGSGETSFCCHSACCWFICWFGCGPIFNC
ncbi:hypothetical protein OIU78_016876 [Salix suchowensis]|nr:hypothetical protein OIU78_016876 [Salix suchowensis]